MLRQIILDTETTGLNPFQKTSTYSKNENTNG